MPYVVRNRNRYRLHVLALPLIVASFGLAGCSALADRATQVEPIIKATVDAANSAAAVAPVFGPNVAGIASLVAAIAGGILAVDKFFEKFRNPDVPAIAIVPPPLDTPKA